MWHPDAMTSRPFALLALALFACNGASEASATGGEPAPMPSATEGEPAPMRDERIPLTPIALSLPGAPFPGYFGSNRCTLMAPLAWQALGLSGPVFQCGGDTLFTAEPDGHLAPASVTIEGEAASARALFLSLRQLRRPTAWVGTTLLRGGEEGLERVRVGVPPGAAAYGAGLEGPALQIDVVGDKVWVLTREAVFRGEPSGDGQAFTRVLAFDELVALDAPGVRGDFANLAPLGDGSALLSHSNLGRVELFRIGDGAPRRLALPEAPPPPPAGVPSPGVPSPGATGIRGRAGAPRPSGGATAPRRVLPVRVGERVLVGTPDDRVLEFRPSAPAGQRLADLPVVPRLPANATASFGQSATIAAAPDGAVLVVLSGSLYVFDHEGGRKISERRSTYGHVEHVGDARFLVIWNEPDAGAAFLDLDTLGEDLVP